MHLHYSHATRELDPAERLFAAVLKRAYRDVVYVSDEKLTADARRFLQDVAPGVARRAEQAARKGHKRRRYGL